MSKRLPVPAELEHLDREAREGDDRRDRQSATKRFRPGNRTASDVGESAAGAASTDRPSAEADARKSEFVTGGSRHQANS